MNFKYKWWLWKASLSGLFDGGFRVWVLYLNSERGGYTCVSQRMSIFRAALISPWAFYRHPKLGNLTLQIRMDNGDLPCQRVLDNWKEFISND